MRSGREDRRRRVTAAIPGDDQAAIARPTNLSAYSVVPNQFNLNLRAGLQLEDGKYDVSLYANNATDQRNIYSRGLLSIPTTSIYFAESQSLAPPATYGITLKAKF